MGADYTNPDTLIAAIGAPLFLFIASRFDRVLGVGPPEQPAGSAHRSWTA